MRGDIFTAAQRLVDLHHSLIGPDGSGAIGDARSAFYRHSHRKYDPDIHDPDRRLPTAEGMGAARTAPIGGIDAYREMAVAIERARRALVTASAGDSSSRAAVLDTWHQQHSTAIRSTAVRMLSDSQISISAAVSWLMMRPEFRDGE
jgi:hypothetical protein